MAITIGTDGYCQVDDVTGETGKPYKDDEVVPDGYDASATYAVGDKIDYSGRHYTRIARASTVGIMPTDTAYWKSYSLADNEVAPDNYDSTVAYAVGDKVTCSGAYYIRITTPVTVGISPTDTTYWECYNLEDAEAVPDGYDSAVTYAVGDKVVGPGDYYIRIAVTTVGVMPTDTTSWESYNLESGEVVPDGYDSTATYAVGDKVVDPVTYYIRITMPSTDTAYWEVYSLEVSTFPTAAQVERHIRRGFTLINAMLDGRGIQTPIVDGDSPISFDIAKGLNSLYAAGRVERMADVDEATVALYLDDYKGQMSDITRGLLTLPDAGKKGQTPRASSERSSVSSNFTDDSLSSVDRVPAFRRGMVF